MDLNISGLIARQTHKPGAGEGRVGWGKEIGRDRGGLKERREKRGERREREREREGREGRGDRGEERGGEERGREREVTDCKLMHIYYKNITNQNTVSTYG